MHVSDVLNWSRDSSVQVVHEACDALSRIADSQDGAEAVVAAKVLDHLAERLASSDSRVRCSTCLLLSNLTQHESTLAAVINPNPCAPLVALVRDPYVAEHAFEALSNIATSRDGAEAAVAAMVLDCVPAGLMSPESSIRQSVCELLSRLAIHETTFAAVIDIKPCDRLVTLLRDSDVAEAAFDALTQLSHSPIGAEAVVAAQTLDHVAERLASPHSGVRRSACTLLRHLGRHESTVSAVLDIAACDLLVILLDDWSSWVVEDALAALCSIAHSPNGAEAALAAQVPYYVAKVLYLHSRDYEDRHVSS
ncbi:armadillo-type protein [Mycena latifolia]|nr:armadillo-type protein [Mycena latifolia]